MIKYLIKPITKNTKKITANIFAMDEKVPASPPKPRNAATIASKKKIMI